MVAAPFLLFLQWQLAADMGSIMNRSADPCIDFYEYACGNFKNKYQLPDHQSSIDPFSQTRDDVNKDLLALLTHNQPESHKNDSKATQMVKQHFKSCMDIDQLEKLGPEPYLKLLKDFGGWPLLEGDHWNEDEYDWMKMNAKMYLSGMNNYQFLQFSISADSKNVSRNVMNIDQAQLGMAHKHYQNTSFKFLIDAYRQYMIEVAVQMGADKRAAEEQMSKVLEFEMELAKIVEKQEDRRESSATYKPFTLKALKERYPKLNIQDWFHIISAATGQKFSDSDPIVNLESQNFLDKLPDLLSRFSKKTLANHQFWAMRQMLHLLAPSLQEPSRKFKQTVQGVSKPSPREKTCLGKMMEMQRPMGAMYIGKVFKNETKGEVTKMIKNMMTIMKKSIDKTDWLDAKTKANAQKKLSNMLYEVAYPEKEISDESWVLDGLEKAKISADTYFSNSQSISASQALKLIQKFYKPNSRFEFDLDEIAVVNAMYNPQQNKIKFPAAFLRPQFFHLGGPDYINYARVGEVIGHEITHGFDDQGREYGPDGNLEMWWSNSSLEEYKRRAQCFIDQYSAIRDPDTGLNLNGINTQGENIADSGGVKMAFEGYRSAMKESPNNDRNAILPGFEKYTTDQLFFIATSQEYCTLYRSEGMREEILSGVHTPDRYRGNTPLRNFKEFAKEFNCQVGSWMNPVKKCQIW